MTIQGRTDEESIEVKTDKVVPGYAIVSVEDSQDIVVIRLDANHLRVLAQLASAAADELDARSIGP